MGEGLAFDRNRRGRASLVQCHRNSVQSDASIDQLAEFATLDQVLRAEQERDDTTMHRLFRHLQTLNPDRTAKTRLQGALWTARHKCRIKLPKAAAGTTGAGGGAQRVKRSKGKQEQR
jgi:hypothetical protein